MFSSKASTFFLLSFSAVASAWVSVGSSNTGNRIVTTSLNHSPGPKHDVGAGNSMDNFTPEQLARAQAYMEHQQNVKKVGFPTDVRSLIQYNHGFAVMSTNSKS